MSKVLKLKRIVAFAIYNNLSKTPPREYPTTAEIKTTLKEIMPALKPEVEGYLAFFKRADEVNRQFRDQVINKEETDKQIAVIDGELRKYGDEHAKEEVSISLDNDAFKTLEDQFKREKWGTSWVDSIESFVELEDAFTAASAAPSVAK